MLNIGVLFSGLSWPVGVQYWSYVVNFLENVKCSARISSSLIQPACSTTFALQRGRGPHWEKRKEEKSSSATDSTHVQHIILQHETRFGFT